MPRRSRQDLRALYDAAIGAVDGRAITRQALASADVADAKRVWVIGAGKAAAEMALGALDVLGTRVDDGLIIVPDGHAVPIRLQIREAGHPLPDQRGVAATRELLALADAAVEDELVICLLSGGGSALLVAPAPGVTLSQLIHTTQAHLLAGTPITELNLIRRSLSAVKGGQLADRIAPARLLTLAISDVPADDPAILASGPTRHARVIGNLAMAIEAAAIRAEALGYRSIVHRQRLRGEAREVGATIGTREIEPGTCHIWGGETTVTVTGEGRGGRSLELALSASLHIDDDRVLLSAGTDGIDGPTDAAGAIVDSDTVQQGEIASAHLADNDAWTYLHTTGDLIVTGPTGTNVADLVILARPRP